MILVNGKQTDVISYRDRGFQFGDGVFETIAVVNQRCVLWHEHMARLQLGCERLQMVTPSLDVLAQETEWMLHQVQPQGVVKIMISRGSSDRGYQYSAMMEPNRVIISSPWPSHILSNQRRGVCVQLCTTTLAKNPRLAQIKHMSRLENVLARAEWNDPEIVEGLMLDEDGLLIEGTMSNVFIIQNNCVYTPPIIEAGVAGVMRQVVLDKLTAYNMSHQITPLNWARILAADAMFITNSLIGIWPVRSLRNADQPVNWLAHDIIFRLQNYVASYFSFDH